MTSHFSACLSLRFQVTRRRQLGITPELWQIGELANRKFQQMRPDGEWAELLYIESIQRLEAAGEAAKIRLTAAYDVPENNAFSIGNTFERAGAEQRIEEAADRLAARRALVHQYASRHYYELKFSGVASDVFSRLRERVDSSIGSTVPAAVQKFIAVHDYLRSENPEDWANAVHSCRRILESLADAIFPPRADRIKSSLVIKLGKTEYKNRLMCYVEDRSVSPRFTELVGSHLSYLGERLDAVFDVSNKGTHADVSRAEADRYVLYTYMIVGDILGLV